MSFLVQIKVGNQLYNWQALISPHRKAFYHMFSFKLCFVSIAKVLLAQAFILLFLNPAWQAFDRWAREWSLDSRFEATISQLFLGNPTFLKIYNWDIWMMWAVFCVFFVLIFSQEFAVFFLRKLWLESNFTFRVAIIMLTKGLFCANCENTGEQQCDGKGRLEAVTQNR